ncbi:hypothetical protein [Streptomyces sp. NPDC008121]|uniref:hypothetical protein n=1 Tax=Streptomyces sp. NPDC008121 TaxID=3364809 RepID=UPI0036EFD65C
MSASPAQPQDDGGLQAQGLIYNKVRVTNNTGENLTLANVRVLDSSRPAEESIEDRADLWFPRVGDTLGNTDSREYGVTHWAWDNPAVELTFKDSKGRVAIYATSANWDSSSAVSRPGSNYYAAGEPAGAFSTTQLDLRNPLFVTVHNEASSAAALTRASAHAGTYIHSPGSVNSTVIDPGGESTWTASTPPFSDQRSPWGTDTEYTVNDKNGKRWQVGIDTYLKGDPVTCSVFPEEDNSPQCTVAEDGNRFDITIKDAA